MLHVPPCSGPRPKTSFFEVKKKKIEWRKNWFFWRKLDEKTLFWQDCLPFDIKILKTGFQKPLPEIWIFCMNFFLQQVPGVVSNHNVLETGNLVRIKISKNVSYLHGRKLQCSINMTSKLNLLVILMHFWSRFWFVTFKFQFLTNRGRATCPSHHSWVT